MTRIEAGDSAGAVAEEGGSVDGSMSPILGSSVELSQDGHAPAADTDGGPGPDDYTNQPGFQESFVA